MEQIEFPIVIGDIVNVVMTLEIYEEDGARICGIYDLKGKINVPPKRWLLIVRDQLGKIEQFARESGVTEMRLGGRDWSPVLRDYEPFEDIRNGLRKRLI